MPAQLLDGRKAAAEIRQELAERIDRLRARHRPETQSHQGR